MGDNALLHIRSFHERIKNSAVCGTHISLTSVMLYFSIQHKWTAINKNISKPIEISRMTAIQSFEYTVALAVMETDTIYFQKQCISRWMPDINQRFSTHHPTPKVQIIFIFDRLLPYSFQHDERVILPKYSSCLLSIIHVHHA